MPHENDSAALEAVLALARRTLARQDGLVVLGISGAQGYGMR